MCIRNSNASKMSYPIDKKAIDRIKKLYYDVLKHKTMMIPLAFSNVGRHGSVHNRKSHTIEVVNISLEIASALMKKCDYINTINYDILASIAELHDIGHTPFGHIGEQTIRDRIRFSNDFFREDYPGYFKHNIFSASIILHHISDPSWVLIDGVLKHSKIFDSNYVYYVAKETNLIKMNYIFRREAFPLYAKENNNQFGLDYLFSSISHYLEKNGYICNKKCPNCKKNSFNNSYSNTGFCKQKGLVVGMINEIDNSKKKDLTISSYLTYEYPLSFEGTIVMIADEIASYLSDLFDYFKYLFFNKHDKSLDKSYVYKKILQELDKLKATFNDQMVFLFCKLINNYLQSLINGNDPEDITECQNELRGFLINSLVARRKSDLVFINDDIIVAYDKDKKCVPLVWFDKNISESVKVIKKSIYELVHDTSAVKFGNKIGSECIEFLIDIYSSHRALFIESYEKYNIFKEMYYGKELTNNLFDTFLKIYSEYRNYDISYSLAKKTFGDYMKKDLPASECFLKAISVDGMSDEFCGILNNIFYREVCFFVASLSDYQAIESFLDLYGKINNEEKTKYKRLFEDISKYNPFKTASKVN